MSTGRYRNRRNVPVENEFRLCDTQSRTAVLVFEQGYLLNKATAVVGRVVQSLRVQW